MLSSLAPVLAPVGHEFQCAFCLEPRHSLQYAFPCSLQDIPLVPERSKMPGAITKYFRNHETSMTFYLGKIQL